MFIERMSANSAGDFVRTRVGDRVVCGQADGGSAHARHGEQQVVIHDLRQPSRANGLRVRVSV